MKLRSIGILLWALLCPGCEGAVQEVRLNIFDYRFIPDQLRVVTGKPVRLLIRNQGREVHRFKGSLLEKAGIVNLHGNPVQSAELENGIHIPPGKTLALVLVLPVGQYEFQCPIRGHRGMSGVLVMEKANPSPTS